MTHQSPEQQMLQQHMDNQEQDKEQDGNPNRGKIVLTIADSNKQMKRDLGVCFGEFGWSEGFTERALEQTVKRLKNRPSYEIMPGVSDSRDKVSIVSYRPDLSRNRPNGMPDEVLRKMVKQDINTEAVCNGAPDALSPDFVEYILDSCELLTLVGEDGGLSLRPGADQGLIGRVLDSVRHVSRTEDGTEIIEKVWQGGRPPLGTEIDDGRLVKADNYRDVSRTILLVRKDEISISEAARQLDCTRKTITNIIDKRTDLYAVVGQ